MPRFFTQYDRPPSNAVEFLLPSKTEQAHRDEYDLNRLVRRYTATGVIATADQIREVYYGDFSSAVDNFDAHLRIKNAEAHFNALPSEVRAYFRNSPEALLRSLQDDSEGNVRKLVELGLVRESRLPKDAESSSSGEVNQ